MASEFQLISKKDEKKMHKSEVKVWKIKNLDYFCSRFERSEFIEKMGYRTAKESRWKE